MILRLRSWEYSSSGSSYSRRNGTERTGDGDGDGDEDGRIARPVLSQVGSVLGSWRTKDGGLYIGREFRVRTATALYLREGRRCATNMAVQCVIVD
jgi:hypothetical protein